MYDLLIRNALIADGSGEKAYKGDVAIFSGVICLIEPHLSFQAKKVIDAEGLVLSPGFIDMHSHSDLEAVRNPGMDAKLLQGITLDVNGNCGMGLFPLLDDRDVIVALSQDVLGTYDGPWQWSDYASFKERLNERGLGINQLYHVAHTPLRTAAMGNDCRREADDEEIGKMCALLEKSLDEGAIGFSSGLYYSPCIFASKKELDAILSVVRNAGKLFAVHHRCEGDDFLESLREVMDLSMSNRVKLQISHLKAIGERNQYKVPKALEMIDEYRNEGLDVDFDQYPYDYGSTSLFSLLPPDIQRLSRLEQRLAVSLENERDEIKKEMEHPTDWDSIYSLVGPGRLKMLSLDSFPQYDGLYLSEIAQKEGREPLDMLLDILSEETGKAIMTDVTQDEEMLELIMRHPMMHFGTDSLFSSPHTHPRTTDASMHLMRRYVSEKNTLTLEQAVRKMSGFSADRLLLKDRGYVRTGYIADLVLFEPVKGSVKYVIMNGKLAAEDGISLGLEEGRVL